MPESTVRCLKTDNRLETDIRLLRDKAIEDVLNAFSCLEAAVESPRRDFLLACADEFIEHINRKVRLATKIASLTPKSVVCVLHDRRDGREEPGVREESEIGQG